MVQCRCGGFLPPGIARCPNCRARARKQTRTLLSLLAGAQAITACACYGAPPMTVCPAPLRDGGQIETISRSRTCPPIDCITSLPDGGDPSADPSDVCFTGQ
jgi:hypothetical protein